MNDKKGAPGLNKVTAADYAEQLEENLVELHQRLRRGEKPRNTISSIIRWRNCVMTYLLF
ncbi:MAG: hypothetical protein L3J89_01830 [Gammaproteobacteria bacterium]|nr:hypothetical protein [Gammaproteobacteria bacterium]